MNETINATTKEILHREFGTRIVCACCGKADYEHHEFKPVVMPAGCLCSVTDWRDKQNIPPVCNNYVGTGGYCKTCEHDKKCHAA